MVDTFRWGVVVVVVDHCGRGRGVIQLVVVAGRLLLVSAGLVVHVGMKQDAKEMEKTPLQTKTASQKEEYEIDVDDRRIIHRPNDLLMVLNCCASKP